MYAFVSYQTIDKVVAGKIKIILEGIGISAFLAHEDISVSDEWRLKILEEIGKADIFISLWSANYYSSWWCIQESGIASFRSEMTIIPLSIDGSIPQGFSGNIQSSKIEVEHLSIHDLLPGLVKADFNFGIELMFGTIAKSGSYRGAEANFKSLLPYIDFFSPDQGKQLLEIAVGNDQVHHASLCATEYLPPIMNKFGHLLSIEHQGFLNDIFTRYAK